MSEQMIEGYRISPLQRRLWLLQTADVNLNYNAQAIVRVEGTLDSNRLKQALGSVVARHEALRTKFHMLPGISIPVQVIGESSFDFQEVGGEPKGTDATSLRPASMTLTRNADTPVLSCRLSSGGTERVLQIDIPALCADAASLALLIEEMNEAYQSAEYLENAAASLQYPDVAEWLNELNETEGVAVGRQHWVKRISDVTAMLSICGAGSGAPEFSPNSLGVNLTQETVTKILAGERSGVWKTSGFLLAAWASLLELVGYERASCMAAVCDGRSDETLRRVIGLLARHVPVSLELDRNESFHELLGRATQELEEAAEWQEYFSWEGVEPGSQNFAGIFYFPFSFEYIHLSRSDADQQKVQFTIGELNACADRFGIHLTCRRRGDELRIRLNWDEGQHGREEVQRLAKGLAALLADAVNRPEVRVGELKILTPLERRKLIEEFNPAVVQFANHNLCLHELITAQAERTPDAVAVQFESKALSYRELDERSERVAAYLRGRHVGPESLLGVCLERSLEMVIALLGVLKAGGAYIPLDPQYPKARLDFMLRDSETRMVITQSAISAKLEGCTAELLDIETICNAPHESGRLFHRVTPQSTAYVLYTSGSTGEPKGVMITHEAIVNHMLWMEEEFPREGEERVLQKTAFSFDASVWEFYAPLMSGGTLVMARPGGQQDREYLVRTLREERITTLQVVPTQLQMLLEGGLEECRSLRRVFCGGEVLSSTQVREYYERVKQARLYNLYGPTETTIDATWGECRGKEPGVTASIGRPIANTQVYILERGMEPVPLGVIGELYIGGAGVGRGYLGRPGMTGERFVPDPFSGVCGKRLYRTGDLGRYLEDGRIEYVGRVDEQVKVRGYRIELGEVEAALREQAGVKEAVVTTRADRAGQSQLVAYVVWREGTSDGDTAGEAELRAQLRRRLPDYMVPSVFVWLEGLPLTPNGKVDRQALPTPAERVSGGNEAAAPDKIEEELLCGIFSEVLGVGAVGREENFFDLGGHSLLATRVISKVRRIFEVELPLRALFEEPTVRGLAERVKQARMSGDAGEGSGVAPPLLRRERGAETPLSFAQQRLWFLDQLEPGSSAYNLAFGVRLSGRLEKQALRRALGEVVRRHEVLRSSFPAPEGVGVQRVAADYELAVKEVDLRALGEEQREQAVERQAEAEAAAPFDLSKGPVLRVKLLVLDEAEHVLLVTMHHIVSDGWSLGVLVREFTQLYEGYVRGAESELPELTVQYGDYALWQREWLQGEVLEQQLAYWRRQLAGVPILQLPTDRPYAPIKNYSGAMVSFTLTQRLTQQLRELSRREGVTLFMTLLAAFQVLLSKYSGQHDIAVGTGIANRHQSESEELIGFFVNALVLRTRLEPELEFRELLKRVRHTTLEAYQHQDVPFEKVLQDLHKDRDLSRTPLFQVMLVFQNFLPTNIEIPGMNVSMLKGKHAPVRTDLDIYVATGAGEMLTGTWVYDPELFDVSTIQRMVEDLKQLLEHIVAQPNAGLSELMLGSPGLSLTESA